MSSPVLILLKKITRQSRLQCLATSTGIGTLVPYHLVEVADLSHKDLTFICSVMY
jgi:hypothetical protein